jgi:hypothetical protein
MTHHQRLIAVAGVAALFLAAALLAREREMPRHEVKPKLETYVASTVLALSYGSAQGEIGRSQGVEDELPLGPESFALHGDNVVILDTVNQRAKEFTTTGVVVRDVLVGRGTDIVATRDGNLLVAEPASQDVVKVSSSTVERIHVGEAIESFRAPAALASSSRVRTAAVPLADIVQPRYDTRFVDDHAGSVLDAQTGQSFAVRTDERLGALNPLGVDDLGNIYVIVEELLPTQTPDVRRTVRKYSPDGALRAVVNIQIDNTTFPARDLIVDGSGAIYHLQPRAEQVRVEKWETR